MNKEREIDGIKVILSNETYNEYKGTLQDQINELQDRIDKAIEYINHENFKRTILVGVSTKKYTRNILDNVLNILKGDNK